VPYRDLISPFRAQAEERRRRPIADRFRRTLAAMTLPYPQRFRLAAWSGRLVKPLSPLLPRSLRVMLDLLPDKLPASQSWAAVNPAQGKRRGRVALLIGCAQSVLDPDINTATIDVLTRNGVEVLVPPSQTCCGALNWHVGDLRKAQSFAAKNLRAFPDDVDAIVTNAAGCGSGMHEYHLILKGTPHEAAAREFRDKVCDVSVYLDRLGELAEVPPAASTCRIAYHDACHLANAQDVRRQPRDLLRRIPHVEILEIADAHLCCGSAGTYNIDQPEIANSLGRQKVDRILAVRPDVIATGNIGCLTQLATHLKRKSAPVPVRHTMQILRDAYAGQPIDAANL
jgi:glycolate oxidase iron-sulfur subunit